MQVDDIQGFIAVVSIALYGPETTLGHIMRIHLIVISIDDNG